MPNPETNRVALFTGYNELLSRQPYKPDKNSRLQVLAAAELIRQGKLDKAYFLAGNISSDGSTGKDDLGGIAMRMESQFHRNLPNHDAGSLAVIPYSMSTREEVKDFKKILGVTDPKNEDSLTVIGKDAHLERIKRAVRRTFGKRTQKISILSHEAILTQNPRQVVDVKDGHTSPRYIDTLYQQIFEKMRTSPEERGFIKRERLISIVDSIPLVGGLALDVINKLRISKILEAKAHSALSK